MKSLLQRVARAIARRISLAPRPALPAGVQPEDAATTFTASHGDDPAADYALRLANEQHNFSDYINVHDLPDIFHYWSNRHLAPPKFHPFGLTDPEQFLFVYCSKFHQRFPDQAIRMISIGCGNCDLEARLARRLVDAGITAFTIECMDINEAMLARGLEHAASQGVAAHLLPVRADFNRWQPQGQYDLVLAVHCLHHVVELEHLFAAIRTCLNPEGYFLTCDVIGRNGHQRWPEAERLIQEFWQELPDAYRYNRLLQRHEPAWINHDCSVEGFEGIRAQDILPLLVDNFHFELFIPYGCMVTIFIDRTFGHNFDAKGEWDRDFIDRVHARDEQGLLSGELKPTEMLAVLRTVDVETLLSHPRLTPEFCIRQPD